MYQGFKLDQNTLCCVKQAPLLPNRSSFIYCWKTKRNITFLFTILSQFFFNCANTIVYSGAFHNWSLIHGLNRSSWMKTAHDYATHCTLYGALVDKSTKTVNRKWRSLITLRQMSTLEWHFRIHIGVELCLPRAHICPRTVLCDGVGRNASESKVKHAFCKNTFFGFHTCMFSYFRIKETQGILQFT